MIEPDRKERHAKKFANIQTAFQHVFSYAFFYVAHLIVNHFSV